MSIGPIFFPWERIPAYIVGPVLFAIGVYGMFATRPLTMEVVIGCLALMALSVGVAVKWHLRGKTLGARDQTPANQPVPESEDLHH